MESSAINYNSIGLCRTDLTYETPICINDDEYAIIPNFGHAKLSSVRFMNDRFFYGSYYESKV